MPRPPWHPRGERASRLVDNAAEMPEARNVKRPTIRDVARRAGVSHQTVSRVIKGEDTVLDATRERVMAAIRELDFVPSAIARSLTSDRTHTLGIVTSDIADHFFGQAVSGAEAEARRQGYFVIIGSVEETPGDDEQAYLQLLLQRRVEGIILARPMLGEEGSRRLAAAASLIPLAAIGPHADIQGIDVVDIDNRQGAFDATTALITRGHRMIATITGPLDWASAEARLQGYRDSLTAAGLEWSASLEVPTAGWGLDEGREGVSRLLGGGVEFTAIFAQSDLLAIGAMTALRAHGMRVPEDVSVVGYDDIPVAAFLDPPLTTVRQPMRDVGATAVRLVLDEIAKDRNGSGDGDRPPRRVSLPASLVSRASVAAPRPRLS
jgi:DNA-binding LacI/PurR family transcriptional regulator